MNSTCPICHAAAVVRSRLSVKRVAAMHAPPARDVERNCRTNGEVARLWPGGFVEACVCESCALGFAWPLVEGDESFFALLHERAGYPRDRPEFEKARQHVASTSDGAGSAVLDVGAGRGDFLLSLPDGTDRHAVEASESLRGELRGRGITAHASLADAAAAGPFRLVTLFHVLQYFADPVAALEQCRQMLAPDSESSTGGTLMISVPNAAAGGDSIARITSPPHPLTRWSPTALERAIQRAGLVPVGGIQWLTRPATALLWDAHAATRARAAEQPKSLAGRIDARPKGRLRTAMLTTLALASLPGVALHARQRLYRSQMLIVCRSR